jgi:hypothetical protein
MIGMSAPLSRTWLLGVVVPQSMVAAVVREISGAVGRMSAAVGGPSVVCRWFVGGP